MWNQLLLLLNEEVGLRALCPLDWQPGHAGLRRASPIVLTTITTIAGLFTLAISGLFWGPLAVAIMGGLTVSTFLTLVVAPVTYAILFGIKYETPTSPPKTVKVAHTQKA
jgi:Cu/Ag efflux pump CusA